MTVPRRTILAVLALAFAPLATAQKTHEVSLMIEPVEGAPLPQLFFEPSGLALAPEAKLPPLGASLAGGSSRSGGLGAARPAVR